MNDPCYQEDAEIDKMLGRDWPMKSFKKHVTDAAIAVQIAPPTDQQWLLKCERVKAAQLNIIKIS